MTIILSTHDMAEAEKMADRVAILLRGKLAAIGTHHRGHPAQAFIAAIPYIVAVFVSFGGN